MLKGLAYNPLDKELVEMRIAVRKLLYAYNNTPPANFPDGAEPKLEVTGSDRRDLLAKIFHLKDGHEAKIEVEPPLWLYVASSCSRFLTQTGTMAAMSSSRARSTATSMLLSLTVRT